MQLLPAGLGQLSQPVRVQSAPGGQLQRCRHPGHLDRTAALQLCSSLRATVLPALLTRKLAEMYCSVWHVFVPDVSHTHAVTATVSLLLCLQAQDMVSSNSPRNAQPEARPPSAKPRVVVIGTGTVPNRLIVSAGQLAQILISVCECRVGGDQHDQGSCLFAMLANDRQHHRATDKQGSHYAMASRRCQRASAMYTTLLWSPPDHTFSSQPFCLLRRLALWRPEASSRLHAS